MGFTPFHEATYKGHFEIVEILILHRADLIAKNKEGRTPLHLAVKYKHTNILKILLFHGADVNVSSNDGKTPLHLAKEKGYSEIVKLFHDIKINNSALFKAVKHRDIQKIKLLLKNLINVNAKNRMG